MAQEDKHHISDFSTNTYGFVMGADTTLNPKFSLGGAFAYADTSIKSNSPITRQQADTSMFQLIVYGNYTLDDRTDATFHAGIGRNSTDAQRDLGFTAATPTASYNSISTHLGASIGRVYKLNDTYSVLPSVKLDHIWIKDDAYTEKGAGILSLLVDSHSVHALVTSVESKLFYQWNDKTTLSCSAGMGFDALNQRNEVTAAYTGAPTSKFKTQGIKPNPWLVQGGVGIIHRYKNNIEISGRYDGEYRGSYTNHTGSIKLVWHF
jgi:autotransporter family porin